MWNLRINTSCVKVEDRKDVDEDIYLKERDRSCLRIVKVR